MTLQRIICLSDLHLGGDHGEILKAKTLTDSIIGGVEPSTSLILLCGDIIDTPSPDLITEAARFCDRLEDAGFCVLVVPGNHDEAVDGWHGVDETLRTRFVLSVVTARPKCMGDVLTPPWYADIDQVRVIMIDSLWALRGWGRRPDLARGKIGGAQLAEVETLHLEAVEAGADIVWMLHHRHGYETHILNGDNALIDQAALASLAAKLRPRLIVCGHEHPPRGALIDLDGVELALVCPKATAGAGMLGWRVEVGERWSAQPFLA